VQKVAIILAEDHGLVRQRLKRLLAEEPGFQLVAETADGLSALRRVIELRPDVLVTDLVMPGLHGLELTRCVREQAPETRVVIVSIHADELYVAQALRHGAMGYIRKDETGRSLVPAVRAAIAGKRYLSPAVAELAARPSTARAPQTPPAPAGSLGSRQRSVLLLVAQGYTDAEIGFFLKLTAGQVARLRLRLMRKLGVQNEADLTEAARKKGLAGRAF